MVDEFQAFIFVLDSELFWMNNLLIRKKELESKCFYGNKVCVLKQLQLNALFLFNTFNHQVCYSKEKGLIT